MKVNFDFSDVIAMESRSQAEVDLVPVELLRCVEMGAAFERTQHEYQNRTTDLQTSTKAVVDQKSRARAQVSLEMGMPYASYIRRKGLSEIDSASVRARDEFQDWAEDMPKRIEN